MFAAVAIAPLQTLEGHAGNITACAVSKDGTIIISASQDRTLKVWEQAAGVWVCTHTLQSIAEGDGVWRSCAISRDNKTIIAGSSKGFLRIWSKIAAKWQPLDPKIIHAKNVFPAEPMQICSFSSSEDIFIAGSHAVTMSANHMPKNYLCLWSPAGNQLRCMYRLVLNDNRVPTYAAAFSQDETVVAATAAGDLSFWKWKGKQPGEELSCVRRSRGNKHRGEIKMCASSFDGQVIVSVSDVSEVFIWRYMEDAANPSHLQLDLIKEKKHPGMIEYCSFAPDNYTFATASSSGEIKIWRWHEPTKDWQQISEIKTQAGGYKSCIFTPQNMLVTIDVRNLKIWNTSIL